MHFQCECLIEGSDRFQWANTPRDVPIEHFAGTMAAVASSSGSESKTDDVSASKLDAIVEKLPNRGSELPIVFGPVHARNAGAVRLLVDRVLPVSYQDSFWNKLIKGTNGLSVMGE